MTGYLCNRLIEKDGVLTGETTGPGGGEILDADGKRRALDMLCMLYGLHHSQAIAGGDGANDLEMIKTAGLGSKLGIRPESSRAAIFKCLKGFRILRKPFSFDSYQNLFLSTVFSNFLKIWQRFSNSLFYRNYF